MNPEESKSTEETQIQTKEETRRTNLEKKIDGLTNLVTINCLFIVFLFFRSCEG